MERDSQPARVCLIGAGNISRTHAAVLAATPSAEAVAVCDPDAGRARDLAEEYGLAHAFGSVEEAISSGTFDRAHVLVPPDLHAPVARQLLAAGIGVLLEKPMALGTEDCSALVALAQERGAPLGVNHNAVFYPAFVKLRDRVLAHTHGALQHLIIVWNLPRQSLPPAGHWMRRAPGHVAFETGVHPFSQARDLAGPLVTAHTTRSGSPRRDGEVPFFDTWMTSMVCAHATAQVCVSYAGSYRLWEVVAICEDGVLTVEVEQNRLIAVDRTRWGRYHQPMHAAATVARQEAAGATGNLAREIASSLRPRARLDPYFTSMRASIAAFHGCQVAGRSHVDGEFGRDVVAMAEAASTGAPTAPRRSPVSSRRRGLGSCDVLVTGGTGFIGTGLCRQLVEAGASVRVLARTPAALPELFSRQSVTVVQADVTDATAVSAAVRGARAVVHLATGDFADFARAATSVVGAADNLARSCLAEGVGRLVFAGTIASLYLGDAHETITDATPVDPRLRARGQPYGWAKAESEKLLRRWHRDQGLPVCIVRPGVVLGAGGTPFHSGFGIWRTDVDCVGWNDGRNPLPLVLAADVADAITRALTCNAAVGSTYNLVGDVRLCARECVAALRSALDRPLVFHPVHPIQHQALQLSKWLLKSAIRHRLEPHPSYRAIRSMGCVAQFDCSDVKRTLGWSPVADPEEFIDRALRAHAQRSATPWAEPAAVVRHG